MMPVLAIAGVIYLILLVGYVFYSIYAFHHLNEFGYSSDTSSHMFRVYLGISSAILLATIASIIIGLVSL
jgi:hypothetical protein